MVRIRDLIGNRVKFNGWIQSYETKIDVGDQITAKVTMRITLKNSASMFNGAELRFETSSLDLLKEIDEKMQNTRHAYQKYEDFHLPISVVVTHIEQPPSQLSQLAQSMGFGSGQIGLPRGLASYTNITIVGIEGKLEE